MEAPVSVSCTLSCLSGGAEAPPVVDCLTGSLLLPELHRLPSSSIASDDIANPRGRPLHLPAADRRLLSLLSRNRRRSGMLQALHAPPDASHVRPSWPPDRRPRRRCVAVAPRLNSTRRSTIQPEYLCERCCRRRRPDHSNPRYPQRRRVHRPQTPPPC